MSIQLRFLQVFVLCCFFESVHGFQENKQVQIKKWIEELGDGDFKTRENAHKNLWKAGAEAEELLKAALKADDAEIKKRSLELLEKFKWGIYQDTPIAIIDQINSYQAGNVQDKEKSIAKLIEMGEGGIKSAIKIISAEDQEDVKNTVLTFVSKALSKVIPYLVEKDDYKFLDQILQMMVENRSEGAFSHFVVYSVLSYSSDKMIQTLSTVKNPKINAELKNELLAYLYRSKGDSTGALNFARDSKNPELYTQVGLEASKWKMVLETDHFPDDLLLGKLGYKIAMHRLSNDKIKFDQAFKELLEIGEELSGKGKDVIESTEQLFQASKIALLNYKLSEGLDLLLKNKKRINIAEIYASRFEFDKIQTLIDDAKKINSKDVPSLEIYQAKILYGLGQKDKALKTLDSYSKIIGEEGGGDWPLKLVQSWMMLKKKDRALDDVSRYLEKVAHREASGRMLNKIFGDDSEYYDPLFRFFFKKNPAESAKGVISKLNGLHDKENDSNSVAKLTENVLEYASTVTVEESVGLRNSVSFLLNKYGLEQNLKDLASKFNTEPILMHLGDLYADKKEWMKARDAYINAWGKDKAKPLPAYLVGTMEGKLSNQKESLKWKKLATWIPLGNEQARLEFAYALGKKNFLDDALLEFDLISKTGEPGSYSVGASTRALAAMLIEKKKYEKAADGYELAMMRCMTPFVSFTQSQAYVTVPSLISRLRCRSAIEKGEFEAAAGFANQAFDLQPGEVELPILVYQSLVMKGQKSLADKIFQSAKSSIQKVCVQYPDCSWVHNSGAWLCACCKNDLDWGLKLAQIAVNLDSKSAAHLDTLAEVLFQLNRKNEALQAQAKAVELEPNKIYYKKQFKRIENGDPDVDRPEENDD